MKLMREIPSGKIDLVVTDPPYLANYRDRAGRSVENDRTDGWLGPAFKEIGRGLKPNSFCVSFYGWHKVDRFMWAWRQAGLKPCGHIVWTKDYASNKGKVAYRHEAAYLLAKGQPEAREVIDDVLAWKGSIARTHIIPRKSQSRLLSLSSGHSLTKAIWCLTHSVVPEVPWLPQKLWAAGSPA